VAEIRNKLYSNVATLIGIRIKVLYVYTYTYDCDTIQAKNKKTGKYFVTT